MAVSVEVVGYTVVAAPVAGVGYTAAVAASAEPAEPAAAAQVSGPGPVPDHTAAAENTPH